ncbi:hypothetical protein Y032_0178g692 [Ancylostoma ceylanicum]|uniref:Uncharacterized protein n=1 Tax=Ancylostoma ceylanicum TaxID=53326 RepID=A0A016STL6_9BILA|nr:hypothetical protein Y032_0178g692 [Ancylostoma ceylanicum]
MIARPILTTSQEETRGDQIASQSRSGHTFSYESPAIFLISHAVASLRLYLATRLNRSVSCFFLVKISSISIHFYKFLAITASLLEI